MRPPEKVAARPSAAARARAPDGDQRFRILCDSVKEYAIFMLDRDGRVETWNPAAEVIGGYCRDEIVGQRFEIFYTPEDLAHGLPDALLARAAATERVEDQGWRVRKDGTRFWAEEVIAALHDRAGRLTGYAKVTRDLTERRNAELSRARAEEAVRLRDEFLSVASHELRTPLTTLRIELRGLYDRRDACDDRMAKRIERSVRNANRLYALIESLLDVSRIATGKLVLKPAALDLSHLVVQLLDGLRATATKAGCTLSLAMSGRVRGHWDRPRLQQVLMNLLANALKYGAGGPVAVTVWADGDDAGDRGGRQGARDPRRGPDAHLSPLRARGVGTALRGPGTGALRLARDRARPGRHDLRAQPRQRRRVLHGPPAHRGRRP